jgi:predicted ATPase/DNA-binding CsgD family transcriptional regulator
MTTVTAVAVDVDERRLDDELAATGARVLVAQEGSARLGALGGLLAEAPMFAATFVRPADALEFARALRRDLHKDAESVPLRIALHAGEPGTGPLTESPVRRATRIVSLAQGGQILLSRSAADALGGDLPCGLTLVDVGSQRPRDLGRPEHVLEVQEPDYPQHPGRLRSLEIVPNNLPVQLTSFVGRDEQLSEVARLLVSGRVLTLSGPGGCGKTRLALQLAARDIEAHPGGVWVADLAPIADPALVPSAVADALGLVVAPTTTPQQSLLARLESLDALLVLDNCEHVVDAARQLVDALVRQCPNLAVLATSREPVGCDGEVTWRVASLSVPDDGEEGISESVLLFVDRACAVRPSFRLEESNAEAVAEICRRLDGIPLAIELAAARARALTPAQIAMQLADRFGLLTGGRKTSLPRHRTLEASVDWSYDLLDERERILLRRLGVFTGGFDLAAAEEVCPDGELQQWHVLDALTGLVDRSLVGLDDTGHGRYRLLETFRQYALSKLVDAGEVTVVRDRHLERFLAIGFSAEAALEGPDMIDVLAGLEVELDNLRAAFDWAMQSNQPVKAWRLASSLWLFWQGHRADEGASRLTAALAAPGGEPLDRAQALTALADLCLRSGDGPRSRLLADEIIALATEAADPKLLGRGTSLIGYRGLYLGDPEAVGHLARALELHRAAGDDYFRVESLLALANAGLFAGDLKLVRASATEALAVGRRSGNPRLLSGALLQSVAAAWMEGELDEMSAALDELLPLIGQRRDEFYGPMASALAGWLLAIRGDYERGLALADFACTRAAAANTRLGIGLGLWVTAVIEDDLAREDAVAALTKAQIANSSWGLLFLAAECSARLAGLAAAAGDVAAARLHVTAIDQLAQRPHGQACRPWERLATAELALTSNDMTLAGTAVHDALATWAASGTRLGVVTALELLVRLNARSGRHLEAARLLGATGAERERMRWRLSPAAGPVLETDRLVLESHLGRQRLLAALAEGAAMELKEAAAYARRGRGARRKALSGWSSLTATELEVASLVAEGLTNAEIAQRLFVSLLTVKSHVKHCFSKLGIRNRAELAAVTLRERAADPS